MRFKVGDKVLVEGQIEVIDDNCCVDFDGDSLWLPIGLIRHQTPAKTPRYIVKTMECLGIGTCHDILDGDDVWKRFDYKNKEEAERICKLLNDAEPKPRVVRVAVWLSSEGLPCALSVDKSQSEEKLKRQYPNMIFHDIEVPT